MFHYNEKTNRISFTMKDVDLSILNGIRRVLLMDIPILGFIGNGIDSTVNIIKNTTVLNNEIIANRIALIPLDITEEYNDNKIDFVFNVKDSKKFYVERLNIIGNYTTIEEVVRNKLIVDEGDPLNNLLFNKSINEIKSLGIFKSVDYELLDGSNQNLKIVNINVEEKPTGEVSLGAGVGTSGSTIGGGILEKNFLGKGINLNTNV